MYGEIVSVSAAKMLGTMTFILFCMHYIALDTQVQGRYGQVWPDHIMVRGPFTVMQGKGEIRV